MVSKYKIIYTYIFSINQVSSNIPKKKDICNTSNSKVALYDEEEGRHLMAWSTYRRSLLGQFPVESVCETLDKCVSPRHHHAAVQTLTHTHTHTHKSNQVISQ